MCDRIQTGSRVIEGGSGKMGAIRKSLWVLCGLLLAGGALADTTLEGVTVPDTRTVDGTTVNLNGVGLRTATMLKVKVYVMALYLETKSSDPAAIIDSTGAARIELHMLRDVGADDMRKAWDEGFENNYTGSADLSAELKALKAATSDLGEGDLMAFDFAGTTVTASHNGEPTGTIEGAEFRRALLSVWLGKKPPNKGLKKGILGQ
jgi:hypothetical protein